MKVHPAFMVLILVSIFSCKKQKQEQSTITDPPKEKKWVVTTVAGQGTASFVNGTALTATFHFPGDVEIGVDGNMYITDLLNFCVRKLGGNTVSTLAGGSGFSIINGNGVTAQFKNPYSITSDTSGNLYTTDENDPRIRKITPGGVTSTFAGSEIEGFANGSADLARFFPGNSIVANAQGNVFVADARNNRVRMVTAGGQVSTIAGTGVYGFNDGNALTAGFASPGGIAIDNEGNLLVLDRDNFRIRKITPTGNVTTIAGTGMPGDLDGVASQAQFSSDMHDIVVDKQGNIYVADESRIRKISVQGVVSTIAGSTPGFADGDGTSAKFNYLSGMCIDAQGNLFVADLNNNRIRKISFE